MKYFKLLIISLFAFLVFSFSVSANSIDSINIDIYVDNLGNANVIETWDAYLTEGTEGYHPYYNLYNSYISDFVVFDNSGAYIYIDNWDINASFNDKKYKNGIYTDGDEVDLCWGISEYGKNKYILKYKINNFIYNTTDGYQLIYWRLIPKNMNPVADKVTIKIHSDKKFDSNLDVWGYGNYGGTAYVYDGAIEMASPETGLKSSDYITVLVKFPKGYFNTNNSINESWNDAFESADEGSFKYSDIAIESNAENRENQKDEVNNSESQESLIEDINANPLDIVYGKQDDNNQEVSANSDSKSNVNLYIIIIIVLGSVLLAVLILLFVFKKKNKSISNL